MIAYIKSHENFPIEDWMCLAYLGFKEFGMKIVLFEEIEEVPLNKNIILVTYIEETKYWFKKMGWIENPELNTVPEFLNSPEFRINPVEYLTMGEAKLIDKYPFFIKSIETKKFIPSIITSSKTFKYQDLAIIPDNTPVIISNVYNIQSEWRAYVINDKIERICYYKGELKTGFPTNFLIERAIQKMRTNVPNHKTYTLDFGEIDNFTDILIEYNDFYSIGNYGLPPKDYVRGLIYRWKEIIMLNK